MTDVPVEPPAPVQRIIARPDGPYVVEGGIPLYRRRIAASEHGESLTWETKERLERRERYLLCRCGGSSRKPSCDGSHAWIGFVADDRATDATYDGRANELGGTGLTVRDDRSICTHAGFCGTKLTNVWKSVPKTEDSTVRSQVISAIEKCPSGALTYSLDRDEANEPLYARAISATDDGPLWVTGGVPVTTSSGVELEIRNRVTLCRCGQSSNKPLCDGSHKAVGFTDS